MQHEYSLPHLQVPPSCPYFEPARSSPYPHIPLLEDPFQYYPPIYPWISSVKVTTLLYFFVRSRNIWGTCVIPLCCHGLFIGRFTFDGTIHVCISSAHAWWVFIPRVPWIYNYLKLKAWSIYQIRCGQENRVTDPITRLFLVPKLKMHEHVPALLPPAACCVKRKVVRRIQTESQVIRVAIPSEEIINCRTKGTFRTDVEIREL